MNFLSVYSKLKMSTGKNGTKITPSSVRVFDIHDISQVDVMTPENKTDIITIKRFYDIQCMYEKYEFTEKQKETIKNNLYHKTFYQIMIDFVLIVYNSMIQNNMNVDNLSIQKEVKKQIQVYFPGPLVQISGRLRFIENDFENNDDNIWNTPIMFAKKQLVN